MAEIYFSDSFGRKERVTDFDWLKDKVFNEDDSFWEGATGDCGLNYSDSSVISALALVGREKIGFMIEHNRVGTEAQTYTLQTIADESEIVEVEIGGESKNYYKKYFAPKETAWQAIKYFLVTGERDPSLYWEKAEYPKQSWED